MSSHYDVRPTATKLWDSRNLLILVRNDSCCQIHLKSGQYKSMFQSKSAYICVVQGILILGQEQDTYGGGLAIDQSFSGLITQFNVWDRYGHTR